jgi:hypothetical protein
MEIEKRAADCKMPRLALITNGLHDDINQDAAPAAVLYLSSSNTGGREKGGKDCAS